MVNSELISHNVPGGVALDLTIDQRGKVDEGQHGAHEGKHGTVTC